MILQYEFKALYQMSLYIEIDSQLFPIYFD